MGPTRKYSTVISCFNFALTGLFFNNGYCLSLPSLILISSYHSSLTITHLYDFQFYFVSWTILSIHFLMKIAISSFYDTMGEDEGQMRHEPPEEVEQVRFLNFFRLIQNIFPCLCENSTYLKVEFLQNIGLLLSNFRT